MIVAAAPDAPASEFTIGTMEGSYLEDLELGREFECGSFTLSEQEIIDFARKFDPQPAHVDREFAARSPAGTVTASACHTLSVAIGIFARAAADCKLIAALKFNTTEMPAPTVPGVRMRLVAKWTDKRESSSRPDRGIASWELQAIREDGPVALRTGATIMMWRRPA
ncbi:MAG: hypothetical protein BroJett024_37760 [Alphaproteobacteria bacterium]|nr:MAG: hypothetical protein BroJett024_37760 [Alphaproteobacteria bacterium]